MPQTLLDATPAADLFAGQVPFLKPWMGDEEVQAAAQVILSGWVCQGPKVAEFERLVAKFCAAPFAVATNSCTSALHLTLRLSGVGVGDEVVMPSHTCMATANAVHHCGAVPVFADIDPLTYNLDPCSAEAAITARTKAVILVHQIGLPGNVERFDEIARRHGISLIEDGACSFGASYHGRPVGGLGHPTCFSFHPRKMVSTAEGGMIVTGDASLSDRARVLRSTGASVSDLDRHIARGAIVQQYEDFGYNYRMTDIQAAIGVVQMSKLEQMLAERRRQAVRYDSALNPSGEVTGPFVPDGLVHSYSSYLVRIGRGGAQRRDAILRRMAELGVSCRVGIQPLHWEPFYSEKCRGLDLPHTEEVARSTMFLPIFPGLTEPEQDRVIQVLFDCLAVC
ncbi:MAG: DegT/DnrJ/EryC1/StrS family aminotransferase [Bryobacterales bacterium]|nr:DegT/DnrJ/EryC1/StrS family aminotransferase [Bryobacterales bacterium]